MRLLSTLERVFEGEAPCARGDRLLVAFSGGADSTALLWGLSRLAPERGWRLHAAHLDHGLDPGSRRRARAATGLAESLGVPLASDRRAVRAERAAGESLEAAARRVRYRFLEEEADRLEARWIVTAHHADDQIETVLLRLLFGSGLEGLAGISPRRGRVVRPLLGVRRAALRAAVAEAGLAPAEDPSNRDLATPRNRIRLGLLPALRRDDPALEERLLRLATTARRARRRVEKFLAPRLAPRPAPASGRGLEIARAALTGLPDPLWPFALALLHRRAGAAYPPAAAARRELRRQVRAVGRVGCDCGDGWLWRGVGDRLRLARDRSSTPAFAYTLEVPGVLDIPELAVRVRIWRGEVADWMFEGSPTRAGLALPLAEGDRVVVRNRRPGDRIQPLGCSYSRRLKEVLIDRRVPRSERDRLPLLVAGERLVWVPGVTIAEHCRLTRGGEAWIAEIEPT